MSASSNGWRVLTRSECVDIEVPGGRLAVHPLAAPIFADLARRFHTTVEPLEWPGCWGYALRPIKGSDTYSNHSSGTAIDLNAPKHPQGVPAARTFTAKQRSALVELLTSYGGVITWGGTWGLPDTDGMHFELADGVTVEAVEALADRLATPPAPTPPRPAPVRPTPPRWAGPDLQGSGRGLRGGQGDSGPRVQMLQRFLSSRIRATAATHRLADDGEWGPQTTAALRDFARRSMVRDADGQNIGPRLALKLHVAGFRG